MTSINHFPTFNYSQPEEYRFSHDSVFLARRVFEWLLENQRQPRSVLDLCAGCGVIGLDVLFHLRSYPTSLPDFCDFLEIQKQYELHFEENLLRLDISNCVCRFINENYNHADSLKLKEEYDLIVCNPPYFSKDQGLLPAEELKQRSRFFIDSDLETLLEFVYRKLSKNGNAFLLIRNQIDHKVDQVDKVRVLCQDKLNLEWLADVRGTQLALLSSL